MAQIKYYKEFAKVIEGGYIRLHNNKETVNSLNVFPVPDGDTGTNMTLTVQHAVDEMNATKANNLAECAAACSAGALMGARGNSGVILSQLMRGFSKACVGKEVLDAKNLTLALRGATDMAYKAVMKPTEGTILTVVREMTEFAEGSYMNYEHITQFLEDIIKEGKRSLENTPNLLPVLKEAGVVDAGGRGLIYIFEGILDCIKGVKEVLCDEEAPGASQNADFELEVKSQAKFTYCTELLIRAKDTQKREKMLIDKLVKMGDSLLVIEEGGVIKIHIHTNEPWNVMKAAAVCGEFEKIKIENMNRQHSEAFGDDFIDSATVSEAKQEFSKEHQRYVLVAVSSGDGLSAILHDLGVNYIISGGQTMNPSTQDFLTVLNETDAENYILFPNNSNIILAAQQAAQMSGKNASVLPTKDIPQAVTALMSFNPEEELKENIAQMSQAMGAVKSGEVTFAVRDTVSGGSEIKNGDIIGICGKEILSCKKNVTDAAIELIEKMKDDQSELITIYYGSDVRKKDAEKLADSLKKKFDNCDIEVFEGGQPLYYYIVSVE